MYFKFSFQLKFNANAKSYNVVELSFIFCSVYLLLGMALIAMCFNLMQVSYAYDPMSLKGSQPLMFHVEDFKVSFPLWVCDHMCWLTSVHFSFQEQVIYKLTNLKKCASQCFKCRRWSKSFYIVSFVKN